MAFNTRAFEPPVARPRLTGDPHSGPLPYQPWVTTFHFGVSKPKTPGLFLEFVGLYPLGFGMWCGWARLTMEAVTRLLVSCFLLNVDRELGFTDLAYAGCSRAIRWVLGFGQPDFWVLLQELLGFRGGLRKAERASRTTGSFSMELFDT